MNKSRIEWTDYTINPVKGLCPMACSYCYARAMYKRFGWNPEIRVDLPTIYSVDMAKPNSKIFVGSTIELFGDWVEPEWWDYIWGMVKARPEYTFIFLTKKPENLIKWSPFPDNCWVGVSITDNNTYIGDLIGIEAKVKFLSVEPLLKWARHIEQKKQLHFILQRLGINWIIIGQRTPISKKTTPKIEWVREIVKAADKANIPVFLKNNLLPLFEAEGITKRDDWTGIRQEMPMEGEVC